MAKNYAGKLLPVLKAEGFVFERPTKHGALFSHPTRPAINIANRIATNALYRHELRRIATPEGPL